jgi:hypothetical protein
MSQKCHNQTHALLQKIYDRTTTSRVVVRNQPTRPFAEAVAAANE